MEFIICLLIGYLLGSINTSVIYSHLRGKDIRNVGSGNAGATNTLRTFGKGAAALVVIFDILKGVIAVLIANAFHDPICTYLAGFGAVLGHNFPLYFGFRGGKGIVTSFAVIITISPLYALIALCVGILIIWVTRYVSLGSILGAVTFSIVSLYFSDDIYFKAFALTIALLAILRHYSNIFRLIQGTERKLGK